MFQYIDVNILFLDPYTQYPERTKLKSFDATVTVLKFVFANYLSHELQLPLFLQTLHLALHVPRRFFQIANRRRALVIVLLHDLDGCSL